MHSQLSELTKLSKKLEPDTAERDAIRKAANHYAENFLEALPSMPGYSLSHAGKLTQSHFSSDGTSFDKILEILKNEVDNDGINTASGRHMGFIPGGGMWVSSIADMLAATTNRYAGIAFSNPGAVKIEHQVIEWLVSIVGYPREAHGNLTSGGSIANLIAVKAARDFYQINSTNVRKSVVYFTAHTHHCLRKALHTVGLHEAVMREVPMNDRFQMDTEALETAVVQDNTNGLHPFLIVASAGTTDTGAVDDMQRIADICETHNIWMHVDAAYGGFFVLLDEMANIFKGIERSHSVVLDPHKTLFLPYGSGTVLVRDRNTLLASNSSRASYLKDSYASEDISPADTGIELSRHNRALRMWLPLQLHGIKAFQAALQEKLLLTRHFYNRIAALGFETGPSPDLSVTLFRIKDDPDNDLNQKLINQIHQDGTVFLSSTIIERKAWIRCAIVSHRTHLSEVELALKMIERCGSEVFKKVMR